MNEIIGLVADRVADDSHESAVTARKPWQPPLIIVGTLEQAELNAGAIDDGDGGTTANNS